MISGQTLDGPRSDPAGIPALQVTGLRVDVERSAVNLVSGIDFSLAPGEIMGLVGESGSGKTTSALALLGYAKLGTRIVSGTVQIGGVNLLDAGHREIRRKRGRLISYVPQDPGASLNPSMRIGAQLAEVIRRSGDKGDIRERVAQAMTDVALPGDKQYLQRFPHQLSGGQQQRVGLAMAFIGRPSVVVLDEPTTGLDVTTQAHVLRSVRELCTRHGAAAVYVSHDLAVVGDLADRITVMYLGRIVESGPARSVLARPSHPYTRMLVAAVPDPAIRTRLTGIPGHAPSVINREPGCVFASRCPLVGEECRSAEPPLVSVGRGQQSACLKVNLLLSDTTTKVREVEAAPEPVSRPPVLRAIGLDAGYRANRVLKGFDLDIPRGTCTAIVGESGSGKTTLAKCLGGLHTDASGELWLSGDRLPFGARARSADQRRAVQYIFQNPFASLNPRRTVRQLITQALKAFGGAGGSHHTVEELLAKVALNARLQSRYPHQLSGGERQRVAIARAIAADPDVLICDEVTSALDVSVQASIIRLLADLHSESDTTIVFITHNLAVVRAIADQVAVLRSGELVEYGQANAILDSPTTEYTTTLLESTPSLSWI